MQQKVVPCHACGGQKVQGKGLYICLRCLRRYNDRVLKLVMQEDEGKEYGYWDRQPPISDEEDQR